MSEPFSSDERVRLALRQLALARRDDELISVHRAESLVISLLLPAAVQMASRRPVAEPGSDLARVIAARLTRAVHAWDADAEPPEQAAMALVSRSLPPVVKSVPDPDPDPDPDCEVPAAGVSSLPAPRSASSAGRPRRVPRAG